MISAPPVKLMTHSHMFQSNTTHDIEFQFDDYIVESLTRADCWHLAEALHHRGLPRIIIGVSGTIIVPENTHNTVRWYGVHGLNILPDGRYIDVTGIYTDIHALIAQWSIGLAVQLHNAHNDVNICDERKSILFFDDVTNFDITPHYIKALLALSEFNVSRNGFMVLGEQLRPDVDIKWVSDTIMHRLELENIRTPKH